MSNSYSVENNEGAGFDVDEEVTDEDYNKTAAASEDVGETIEELQASETLSDDDSFDDVDYESVLDEAEKTVEEEISGTDDSDEPEEVEDEPVEEEVVVEEAVEPEQTTGTPFDEISYIGKVIRIIDTYRKLGDEEKTVVIQFITEGEMDEAEENILVERTLNADRMLTKTMIALREAYEEDPVERAFYTMSLDTKTLHSLGRLVSVFTGKDYETTLTNLSYSREVVNGISELGEREISFIKATESVLAAAVDLD